VSKAAFTVRAFGYYLVVLGIALAAAPNLLLTMFLMPPTGEVWIRVVGLLVFNIGVYYIYAARYEATAIFKASVFTRTLVLVGFAAFVLMGLAEPMLIVFGAVDFLGGLWTWRALKSAA
jgi:phosphoglycerol transferase MdoB-like AlkP superfamily enzyme